MNEDTHVQVPAPRKPVDPYGMIDAKVMRDETLPQQVKFLYANLATYADAKTRECFPSLPRLARESGMGLRTVRSALRCGESVGLFDVRPEYASDGQRSSDPSAGNQTSNRVALRDFGRGYVAGHGPGRTMPSSKRAATVAGGGRRDSPDPTAPVASKHDHVSETTGSPTTTPRGEHVDASAPSQAPSRSHRQKFRLFKPGDFDTYPPGKAAQYAMRAYARALATVGKVPSDKGRKQVGAWFKTMLEKGQTHERTWELFRQYVDSGVAGGDYSWLVDDPRPAPEPDPDDFVAYIAMREEVEEWKVATFGEEFTDAEASTATGMYGAEQPIEKIRRTLRAHIREDQAEAVKERAVTDSRGVYSVSCDDCEATVGRWCRDDDGKPMVRVCHPWRFDEAGVTPANRAS